MHVLLYSCPCISLAKKEWYVVVLGKKVCKIQHIKCGRIEGASEEDALLLPNLCTCKMTKIVKNNGLVLMWNWMV
jgi:hypothetical protein